MGGIARRLTALLLGTWLLLAGCGGGSGAAGAPPAAPVKSCLEGGEQAFSFAAAGGDTAGVVLGSGKTGVVLGHQAASDLCEWMPRARELAAQGRQVLAFDFGQAGQIEQDMMAAAAELRRRGADRLVLVGSSMGGTAAIAAAARITPPVAGVVAVSSPEEFQGADAAAVESLYEAVPGDDKRLVVVEGGGHGTTLFEFGDRGTRLQAELDRFLKATLDEG